MNSSVRPAVHPADWTPERISSFWDNYASVPHFRERFFSLTCGEGILEFVDRFVASRGVFLDYGCGQGDLMQILLSRGRRCFGVDSSPENVRLVTEKLAGQPGFLGAGLASQANLPVTPDTAMVVEVIEHMPRAFAVDFLRAVASFLPSGGHIVITCPNQEDLARAEVLCPECACRFHPVQHMQSLAPADVAALAESAGFDRVYAGATRFRRKGQSRLARGILAAWYTVIRRSPHLVYVGRKR